MTYDMSLPFQFQVFVYFIIWGDLVRQFEAGSQESKTLVLIFGTLIQSQKKL